MAYSKKTWTDRQVEHPGRRKLTETGAAGVYDVTREEGLVIHEGDPLNAATFNNLESRISSAFTESAAREVFPLAHVKSGTVHRLSGLPGVTGIVSAVFTAAAAYAAGDTFTVDGAPYAIQLSNGEEAEDNLFVSGASVPVVVDTAGKKVNFKAGGGGYKVGDILSKEQYKMKYGTVYETLENNNSEIPLTGLTISLNSSRNYNYLKGNLLLCISGYDGVVVNIETKEVVAQIHNSNIFTDTNTNAFISDDSIYVCNHSGKNVWIYDWNFQIIKTFSIQGDGIHSMLGTDRTLWVIDNNSSIQYLRGYSTEDGSLLKNIQLERAESYEDHTVAYADDNYVYVVSPIYYAYQEVAHKLYRYSIKDGSKSLIKTIETDRWDSSDDYYRYSFSNVPYFWNKSAGNSNYLKLKNSYSTDSGSGVTFRFYDKNNGNVIEPVYSTSGCYYRDENGVEYELSGSSDYSAPSYVVNYSTHKATPLTISGMPLYFMDNDAAVSSDGTIYFIKGKSLFIHYGTQSGVEIIK